MTFARLAPTVSTAVFAALLSTATFAADLAAPTGDALLRMSGAIAVTNSDTGAVFDIGLLHSLPQTTYETTTIWTEGVQVFTGVLLSDLLAAVGGTGTEIEAKAINDYAVAIPIEDARAGGALVAYLLNGQEMSIRDKGPLWVVYPYDSDSDLQSEVVYSRSIWQLDRLTVLE